MLKADLLRLEERFLNAMAVPEQMLYDNWLLRYAPHDVKRSRSINILAASRLPLDEKLDYCELFHRTWGQAPLYRLTSLHDTDIDDALSTRSYRRFDESIVMTVRLETQPAPPPDLRFEPMDAHRFVQVAGTLRSGSPESRAAHLRRLRYSPLPQFRLSAWQDDSLLGIGLSMREDEWTGLFDLRVDAGRRRQGYGRALCRYLMEQARLWGSEHAWLAVEAENEPAVRLYQSLGFREAYRYWYREGPELK